MASKGRASWALGLALLGLGLWWLLRQPSPEPIHRATQPAVSTPVPSPIETPAPPPGPRLAIVIDDWGYQSKPVAALRELGIPVTTAILPSLAFSRMAAEASHAAGNEVILHCPMQAKGRIKPEADTLKAGMGSEAARAMLAKDWASVPYAVGLNNHEGSLASEDAALMAVVAGFLKDHNGYFLDSVTTAHSAIPAAAQSAGVPWAARRVFLDNKEDEASIRKELAKAVALALKNGSCIAIGHPHASTLAVLKAEGPGLEAQGLRLVHVSDLLKR